jgi:homoserine O-acetyltransferase/O-succinyltransferase
VTDPGIPASAPVSAPSPVPSRWRLHGAAPEPDGSNVLLFLHSLTGEPDPEGWWPGLVGRGRLVDPRRWAILAPDLVPAEGPVTTRRMAETAGALLDQLGLPRVHLAAGGSVGGMVALEWAATFPDRADHVVVFAAPAVHPAQATGWNHVQREAIRLGAALEEAGVGGGTERGLALARMAAMLTYRTPDELDLRFGAARREDGRFEVASWLDHHGRKLVARFGVARYLRLLDAMDAHDVGAGRGGVARALGRVRARLWGVGIGGDLLYPPDTVLAWCEAAGRGATYREIESLHGHDAFLLEEAQVGEILEEILGPAGEGRKAAPVGRTGAAA